jgi:lipoprotein-anchoring transpeptidase ErfK/SrfK
MNILKIALAIGMSVVLSTSVVAPAAAALWYNAATNQFEEAVATPGGRAGSPIKKSVVDYETTHKPGTIVIETGERRLYLVLEDGKALKYGIGVGREGFTWAGTNRITRKAEWPGWTPPAQMRKRVPDLPAYMPGGPDNPLGARALYLGSTLYRIHGSNEADTIGSAVSSGCIRMTNRDVADLYSRARIGTKVVVKG